MASFASDALSVGISELLNNMGEAVQINAENVFCLVQRDVNELEMRSQGYDSKIDLQIAFKAGAMTRVPELRTAVTVNGVKYKLMGLLIDPGVLVAMDLHKIQ